MAKTYNFGRNLTITKGETERAFIKNIICHGGFGAALASSFNVGCAIKDLTLGEFTTNIRPMPLIFFI